MKLQLEINKKRVSDPAPLAAHGILITPPIDEDYWIYRVPVSDKQAVVGFPKFGVIGIGFQHEDDWNCNLPSSVPAEAIFKHIAHNKGDSTIADADCISAICMIQEAVESAKQLTVSTGGVA